ncbi:hypothetical protein ACYOEI_17460 [Singulisphaera rosea]
MGKHSWINIILIGVIAVGGYFAWQTGRERRALGETYERLSRKTGEFAIEDPTKLYVRALKTAEPFEYAWRVHVPASRYMMLIKEGSGSSSRWSGRYSGEFLARVRIRESDNGKLQVYTSFGNTSTLQSVGEPAVVQLLHNRLDQLVVEQLGSAEIAAIDPDRPAVLLRLALSDELKSEARKSLSKEAQSACIPMLYEFNLIPALSTSKAPPTPPPGV